MIIRDLRILPLLDITGITENQLSRINREYVDHHETREGKHTTHMLPSDDYVVVVVLPADAERMARFDAQAEMLPRGEHHGPVGTLARVFIHHSPRLRQVRATLNLPLVGPCFHDLLVRHHRHLDPVDLCYGLAATDVHAYQVAAFCGCVTFFGKFWW